MGEFGLIDKLTGDTKIHHASTKKGVGDDAAVIDTGGDEYTLVSTDMLVEGVHFDMTYVPLMHLGYKSVIVNLSDIYAMNGEAKQITVSIAVSNRFSVEALDEIYKGIHKACELYQVDLVGGDTTSSLSGLIISVTAIGTVKKEEIVYRSGGKENDLLVVTGDLGGAFTGLQVLEREKQVYMDNPNMQPELEGVDYILERQLKPEARKDIINHLSELGVMPTSMIDISDGLASEIMHLCKAGELGAQIFDEKLPIDQQTYDVARQFNLDPSTCALNGGEDYELLFTVDPNDLEKVKYMPDVYLIGEIVPAGDGITLHTSGGQVHPLKAQGWNHFEE